MDLRYARARQPEIVRSVQKDANYTQKLTEDLSTLLRTYGGPQYWIKYNQLCKFISELVYHGFACVHNIQTLGEEYTGIIQVDNNYKQIPSRLSQLVAIILEFGGEALYLRVLQRLEEYIENHDTIVPEAKRKLITAARVMRSSPSYLKALHKSLFYFQADKYQISKRVTGINYVLIRHWLQPEFSLYGYKILGFITFLQVAVSLMIGSFDAWKNYEMQQRKLATKETQSTSKQVPGRPYSAITSAPAAVAAAPTCTLCLESRTYPSITPCGHIFCWTCILDWLDERSECPLCREATKKSNVVQLLNYF